MDPSLILQALFWLALVMAVAQDLIWITVVVAASIVIWRTVRHRMPMPAPLQTAINWLVVVMAALLLADLVSPLAGPQSILRR
jgi:hypothetical protein